MTAVAKQGGTAQSHRGKRAYLSGLAAEDIVERHYIALGCRVETRRWRGAGAEIDLIFRDGDRLLFVEVKAGATFDDAAQRIGWPQIHRIMKAAEVFAAQHALSATDPLPEMRIDAALVDGQGMVQIIENVSMAG
jgi:putative endonuclease